MHKLKIGERYATVTGLPVLLVGMESGFLMLQSLVTDNQVAVPGAYPLQPISDDEKLFETRSSPYYGRSGRDLAGSRPPKQLAPVIDALLMKGGLTMKGLVRELKRRASSACGGKNVPANIRARLYWMRRRGCQVCLDDSGRVHVTGIG